MAWKQFSMCISHSGRSSEQRHLQLLFQSISSRLFVDHIARTRKKQTWHLGFQTQTDTHPKGCASAGPALESDHPLKCYTLAPHLPYPSPGPRKQTALADGYNVSLQSRRQIDVFALQDNKGTLSPWGKGWASLPTVPFKRLCFLCSELLTWVINTPCVQHPPRPTSASPPRDWK